MDIFAKLFRCFCWIGDLKYVLITSMLEKNFSGCHDNGDGQVNPEATNKLEKEAALSDLQDGK